MNSELLDRSRSKCELCGSAEEITSVEIVGGPHEGNDALIVACRTCADNMDDALSHDINHWRCLTDSMWSEVDAVKVASWRILQQIKSEGWPQDLIDMFFLDEETKAWAEANEEGEPDSGSVVHMDSNGVILSAGDSVVLIKDLKVKGGNFVAKRGTAVRRISLVRDNAEHIEGRVNDQQIVILTKFVKKT